MIDVDQFKKRGKELWKSQQSMAAARYWKTGKRKGQVRVPAQTIYFTEMDLLRWLWQRVGVNAVLCPCCNSTPIDILSLTIDHIVPRSCGGQFSLDNMAIICKDCNQRKGEMSQGAFSKLLDFIRRELAPVDQATLLDRLKAAHHGARQRFNRPKAKPKAAVFELPPFS
ncbi:MAG TPA: HNH endonuclease signature motif containing protein [Nitrospira sp.]|nr:HNH endonuclease signature motif containing protein [Nitrospira sp.]